MTKVESSNQVRSSNEEIRNGEPLRQCWGTEGLCSELKATAAVPPATSSCLAFVSTFDLLPSSLIRGFELRHSNLSNPEP
jgi:hypothetical protein